MNGRLDLGVDADHGVVQFRVVLHHDLGLPSRRDEDCIDARADRGREDIADLHADAVAG